MESNAAASRGGAAALRRAIAQAIDLLFPERCVHCGRFGDVVCAPCLDLLDAPRAGARCPVCSALWAGADNCPGCFHWDALDGASAVTDYDGVARDMIRALKYRRVKGIAPIMAARLEPLVVRDQPDAVFPVPLHRSRQRDRGFNQAELVAARLQIESPPGQLVRRRKTRPQFGLSRDSRSRNVAGAFEYRGPSLAGLRVALLDDVITTGATANECARVLRDAGAASVRALSFARAGYRPAPPDAPLDL